MSARGLGISLAVIVSFSITSKAVAQAGLSPAESAEVRAVTSAPAAARAPVMVKQEVSQTPQNPFAAPWTVSRNAEVKPAMAANELTQDVGAMQAVRVENSFRLEPELKTAKAIPQSDAAAEPVEKMAELARNIPAKYDVRHIGDRGIGHGMNFYSLDKEEMWGKELSQQVEEHAKLFTDPVINEYVNRLGQNLVRNSDARVPFTIKVIDSDEVNAFALPGGFFYVNTGLIMAADNEAELAGVMAHEIAHVAARHATKSATKQEIWNIASLPLIFVGGPAGMAIRNIAGLAVPMSFLKFGRDQEREADLLGLEYEYAAGYDPGAFVQFFEKLNTQEKKKRGFVAKAFSTHPMNDDRIKRAQNEIETMLPAQQEYLMDSSEFQQMKARLAHLLGSKMSSAGYAAQKPVLRRSQDEQTETMPNDGRPTLKKR